MIKGFDDLTAGRAKELSGIAAPDDRTVVFTLTRPDATFLHLLALNFAHVVPREEVKKTEQTSAGNQSAPVPSSSLNGFRASASFWNATPNIFTRVFPISTS